MRVSMNLAATPDIFSTRSAVVQPWRQATFALVLLVAWVMFLYRETGSAMVEIWARSETFAHAFLVPPIVIWLVWRQRRVIAAQTPQPTMGALVLIACAAFVWYLGDLAVVNSVTQMAFVALLVLSVPAVLGWPVTQVIIFPLGFLFFAVPTGEFLMPQLMEWTANFTVFALRLSGIPVYREGLQFVIPSGSWSVVEACSGVRYLIASLTVGTLFAYLNFQSNKRRILFVLVSIVVPVVANWMRAYFIVLLGHVSGNKIAAGVDHLIYGWLFFGVVIMLMFFIGVRWAEPEKVAVVSGSSFSSKISPVTATRLWFLTACIAALVALPHIVQWEINRPVDAVPVQLALPSELSASWRVIHPGVVGFKPSFQNPSAEINNSYTSQGRTVGLYLGYYQHQNFKRKLISSANVLATSNDPQWAQVSSGRRIVALGGKQMAVQTTEFRDTTRSAKNKEHRLVVWKLYWISGTVTASEYLAKIYSTFYRLIGRGDDSAVIIFYAPKDPVGGADEVLESFVVANYATINELFLTKQHNK